MKRAAPPVAIESVSHHKDPAFAGMMRLFEKTFPAKEKIDRRYFKEILAEKRLGLLFPFNAHILIARRGKRIVGFATGTYLAVVNMGFVGYLAVREGLKGLNLGGRLRHRLVSEFRRDARAAGQPDLDGILGEIEAHNPWLRHIIRERGALALDLDYRQPPLRRGGLEVPLVLYVEPVRSPILRLGAARVRALLYAIYRRLYRLKFPLRERSFQAMLKSMGTRRSIGPRRLGPVGKVVSHPASGRGRDAGRRS